MSTETAPPELRVLIVDDQIDTATSFSYVLQILGCKTAVAFGAAMGLRVAQLFQPNLIFIDLGTPAADGCETLAAMRALEGPVATAMFVCLTSRNDLADEQRCIEAGFHRFVSKPMDAALLPELLAQARAGIAPIKPANSPPPVDPTPPDSAATADDRYP
jgi:CheY-like chemotaxis protein